ncbi:MAG: DUF1343 domain-containing protein [Oligoflexia bacterium]|nr:DUF1343 domain-containing protein [Oligoflexia bacterium]
MRVITGLECLLNEKERQKLLIGKVGLLTNSAAVTTDYQWSVAPLKQLLGERLIKLFGPQHGLLTNLQDNMIETVDFFHPYWQLPVYSLYSDTRSPTDEMLDSLDTIVVDLQDIGSRVYTYIYTMTLLMESVRNFARNHSRNIRVVVLDRPNPVDGEIIEGNILALEFSSFVGRHQLPARHAMTIAEIARFVQKFESLDIDLHIVPMLNWQRKFSFAECGLPWVIPSPNISSPEAAYTFVGTVLFEGTNISEGRGTVRALEIVGHPTLDGFKFAERIQRLSVERGLQGFCLRPLSFIPTFNKHQGIPCGGIQIHPTDLKIFRPWRLGQLLLSELYQEKYFQWKQPPYEYEFQRLPIDIINGSDKLRQWIEKGENWEQLMALENNGREKFIQQRAEVLLY